jgi:hypothetical protein
MAALWSHAMLPPKGGPVSLPPIEGTIAVTGLVPIEKSVTARQNQLAEHIATLPVLDLCKGEGRLSGLTRWRYWWERVAV